MEYIITVIVTVSHDPPKKFSDPMGNAVLHFYTKLNANSSSISKVKNILADQQLKLG